MMTDEQIKTVMLMYDLENAFGDLYEIFSKSFPEHDDLWQVLIAQEREHAEAVRNFYRLYYEGETVFDVGKIRAEAVQSIIDHVEALCDRARKGNYTALQALTTTYDLESSLVARNTFNQIGASETFAETLRRLQKDSENHARLAKIALEKM